MLSVNVTGVVNVCQAALPHLVENHGNIVNVSSVAGVVGVPYATAYSATKGAVLMLSKSLAVEYAHRGVRVNAVCPGHVLTPMTAKTSEPPANADMSLFSRLPPLVMPPAAPEEIAAIIAYLGSEEARYVTGAHFVIDGGQSAI
jgi:meso-butanediol dehydrogenase/(S,S)-butanediol dehydrogenase/diacetyl reductase